MTTTLIFNVLLWQWDPRDKVQQSTPNFEGSPMHGWITTKNGLIDQVSGNSPPDFEQYDLVIDAANKLLLPGLCDSHIHVGMLGESKYFLNLSNCMSIQDLQFALQSHMAMYPNLTWIQGVNWDQTNLQRYPTKADIDAVCMSKPVFLWRACWHIGVANSLALSLANINLDTISPPGGRIDTTAEGGPTGILRERAVELMTCVMCDKSEADIMWFLKEGMKTCVEAGLTAVHTNDSNALSSYKKLQEQEALPMRVFLTPDHKELCRSICDSSSLSSSSSSCFSSSSPLSSSLPPLVPYRPPALAHIASSLLVPAGNERNSEASTATATEATVRRDLSGYDSRLVVERLKIFGDGSLGAETAALRSTRAAESEPDTDTPPHTGVLIQTAQQLTHMITHARSAGFRVEVHAIGDAAAEQVLKSLAASGVLPSERPILTHCQVLGADLIAMMQSQGVIADVQPSFVPTDMRWVQDRLTTAKIQYSYAWKTLLTQQVHVAGGSDAPIESPSPFVGMYDAIFRRARPSTGAATSDNTQRSVFRPEECLTFSQALWLYTVGGAFAAQCEDVLGCIAPNYAADFVLVDVDVSANHEQLASCRPELVIVGGKPVFIGPSFQNNRFIRPVSIPALQYPPSPPHIQLNGPFIPGKAGKIIRTAGTCACALQGRDCILRLR